MHSGSDVRSCRRCHRSIARPELTKVSPPAQGSCRVFRLRMLTNVGQAAVATSLFFLLGLRVTAGAGEQFSDASRPSVWAALLRFAVGLLTTTQQLTFRAGVTSHWRDPVQRVVTVFLIVPAH